MAHTGLSALDLKESAFRSTADAFRRNDNRQTHALAPTNPLDFPGKPSMDVLNQAVS